MQSLLVLFFLLIGCYTVTIDHVIIESVLTSSNHVTLSTNSIQSLLIQSFQEDVVVKLQICLTEAQSS